MTKLGPSQLRETNLKKNIGNLVSLTTSSGTVYGKIIDVHGREIILNPHRTFRYNEKMGCNIYELVNENSYLEVSSHGYYIEPLTPETLNYFIDKQNQELMKEKKKHEEKSDN